MVKPRPFIGLLILDLINQFIFGHGVIIYYLLGIDSTSSSGSKPSFITVKTDPSIISLKSSLDAVKSKSSKM